MSDWDVLIQQIITGLSNGMIIALIALGYTMVYGIVELINFAHGDLFLLGCFLALTLVGALGLNQVDIHSMSAWLWLIPLFIAVPVFCALVNWAVDKLAYLPLRNASKMAPLVSAIGARFKIISADCIVLRRVRATSRWSPRRATVVRRD